jgi:hypothetical protein
MRLRNFSRFSFCLAVGLTAARSNPAHADEDLPAIHTLPCASVCANSSRAVGVTQPKPPWPRQFLESKEAYVEGYVRVHYKINTDGHVSDVALVSVVGPKEFADRTISTVNWVYKPATLDGQPVTTCHTLLVTFKMKGRPGARDEIVEAYKKAGASAKAGEWDQAEVLLTESLAKPKLNLYERGMLSNLASVIAMKKADYLEAHRLSSEALVFSRSDLPMAVGKSLLETRIKSALMLNDIVDALDAADWLKRFDPSNPAVKISEEARTKAEGTPVLYTSAKIPEVQSAFFGLYRRNFAFQDVQGALSGFTLNCKQQAIESQISETAEWHVPKSWSDCRVLVHGTPGTTFKLVQLNG